MSKAILVIDMPDCCGKCPLVLMRQNETWCKPLQKRSTLFTKPDWCPLKIAPKIQTGYSYTDEEDAWIKGYNNCVREIIGE